MIDLLGPPGRGRAAWLMALSVLALACAAAHAAPARYSATALSSGNSMAYGLNARGDVSLAADDVGGGTAGWVKGVLIPVPMGSGSRVSSDGRVGVLVDNGDGRQRPGLFDLRTGDVTVVGPPHTLPPIVRDANRQGVAVGYASEAPPNAEVFSGGSELELGQGSVNAINSQGEVAGTLWHTDPLSGDDQWWAFSAAPGSTVIQWIAPISSGLSNEAVAMDSQRVVGVSDVNAGSGSVAFYHHLRNGLTVPLAGLGGSGAGALGVNTHGAIVGWAATPGDADYRAVLWTGRNQVHDLNQLSDVPAGWLLYEAVDINPKGQIVANGADAAGNPKAFLLTPVSGAQAPATVSRPRLSPRMLCEQLRPWVRLPGTKTPAACRWMRGR
ncbi:hypothetical protein [Ideonella alba]|uniref:HAF repeat-containing protein n=1 Tax=Ideonella alba TaxID=2824118 RepID=A0A940YBI6_9BURK|nr:hypothetical protein [Ideonella alba]MBQ0929300.1 hypothetical protein [Ideonella alba]